MPSAKLRDLNGADGPFGARNHGEVRRAPAPVWPSPDHASFGLQDISRLLQENRRLQAEEELLRAEKEHLLVQNEELRSKLTEVKEMVEMLVLIRKVING